LMAIRSAAGSPIFHVYAHSQHNHPIKPEGKVTLFNKTIKIGIIINFRHIFIWPRHDVTLAQILFGIFRVYQPPDYAFFVFPQKSRIFLLCSIIYNPDLVRNQSKHFWNFFIENLRLDNLKVPIFFHVCLSISTVLIFYRP
jgi:hypothetical protein